MTAIFSDAALSYLATFPKMTYDSIFFLLFFLIVMILYWLMPVVPARQAIIFLANIFFYVYAGGVQLLAVIFVTSLIVYWSAMGMNRVYARYELKAEGLPPREKMRMLSDYKRQAKRYLVVGLFLVLGILVYVKAARLLGGQVVSTFGEFTADPIDLKDFSTWKILIPLGLSYYTLSAAGYLLDIFWRKAKADRNYFRLILCMTFFPTIVEGPICHYDKMMVEFGSLPGFKYENVTRGLQLMIWGLIKKSVIADRLSVFQTSAFSQLGSIGSVETLAAIAANVFCIYADFSGCMDIAIGTAECIGIHLPDNFNRPFFSKSAAEFWRRWHITLGGWFRDYVYMPIATNPSFMKSTNFFRNKLGWKGYAKIRSSAIPLMIVWILTGLWHGTGADYLTWGLYWGILIILENALAPLFKKINTLLGIREKSFSHRLFQMIRTFVYFAIGRMITVLGRPSGVIDVAKSLFRKPDLTAFYNGSLYNFGLDQKDLNVVLFGLFIMWTASMIRGDGKVRDKIDEQSLVLRWIVYIAAVLFLFIFGTYGPGYSAAAFTYGNF